MQTPFDGTVYDLQTGKGVLAGQLVHAAVNQASEAWQACSAAVVSERQPPQICVGHHQGELVPVQLNATA